MTTAKPPVVSDSEWRVALGELARQEEEVSAQIDALTEARKRMPMVQVEQDYRFLGADGEVSLVDLFEGRSQLILYRFFFEEGVGGWPDAGCVGCSSWADGIADLGLVHARDVTLAMTSPAPQASLKSYADRMGWADVPWYTIATDSFTQDFGATDWFALNVFLRDGSDVYRTYYLQNGSMVSSIGSVASLLALTPYGQQIETENAPDGWPQEPVEYWMRRHDEFDGPPPSLRHHR